jgi:hypothetical protein
MQAPLSLYSRRDRELALPRLFERPQHAVGESTAGGFASTFRDLALIAAGWTILIGAILHPAVQLIGLFATSVALCCGAGAAPAGSRALGNAMLSNRQNR